MDNTIWSYHYEQGVSADDCVKFMQQFHDVEFTFAPGTVHVPYGKDRVATVEIVEKEDTTSVDVYL